MGETHETVERKRRAKLSLAEKLMQVDGIIKTHEEKLAAARKRRESIIAREESRAREALDAVNSARALQQVPMPGVTE